MVWAPDKTGEDGVQSAGGGGIGLGWEEGQYLKHSRWGRETKSSLRARVEGSQEGRGQ